MRTTIPLALTGALLLVLAAMSPALGAAPKVAEDKTKFVLSNDQVTVWFQGKKPMLKLFPSKNATAEENSSIGGAYTYRFLRVVEFRDVDGNGIVGDNEALATLALDDASAWNVTRTADTAGTVLNLTLNDTVKLAAAGSTPATPVPLPDGVPGVVDRHANVSLVFTLRDSLASVVAGTTNVTIPASSVKYDFVVRAWPWIDAANDRLALVSEVTGNVTRSDSAAVSSGVVQANGTALGALGWTNLAQGTTDAGASLDVPVRTALDSTNGTTVITHVYDAPGLRTLVHDPTIGLADGAPQLLDGAKGVVQSIKPSPAPGLLVGLGAVGIAALGFRLRRR